MIEQHLAKRELYFTFPSTLLSCKESTQCTLSGVWCSRLAQLAVPLNPRRGVNSVT